MAAGRSPAEAESGPVGAGRPLIGILGGLGPAATVDFYAKVVARTPATSDQGHVRLLIDGDPEVPDRSAAVAGTGASSAPALVSKARRLVAAGAQVLAMPCNSAHAFVADIRKAVDLPFVSIIDETVKVAVNHLATRDDRQPIVGVIATSATRSTGLYPAAFSRHRVSVVEPEGSETDDFMALLYRIKGGEASQEVRAGMAALAVGLVSRGAAVIIAGCTEVPLVLDQSSLSAALAAANLPDAKFIDSSAALADAIVALGT